MKYGILLLVLITGVFMASLGFSQDDVITLNSDELGPHERPLVDFPHTTHADVINCVRCHHDFDDYGNNIGAEGQKCSDCHSKAPSQKNAVPLLDAYHFQCKGCHEALDAAGRKSGPVMCGECHKRN
jgi:hypothetical protein